ncbi:MAG: type IV pilus assembly protein PilM [Candidatus Pacebacteria bacterium]|nr:type IV pilus assembly protein PilM [Candidatus Paceibacterota bacterium]
MPATALDIGTYTLKALTGSTGSKFKIDKAAEMSNSLGFSYPKDDTQAEQLLNLLNNFFNDHKLPKSDVRLSLPEDAVSTKVIELPPLTDAELASAIGWQAEQHIPIPQEELTLEYQVLYRPPKKDKNSAMRVLIVGTKTELIERYTNIFLNLGIQPKIMETQVFSIIRSLEFEPKDPTTLIVHLGANSMLLAVVSQAELKLTLNHQGGGELLTKTLQQAVNNLNQQQAEQYKANYGLDPNQLQGKIRQHLLGPLQSFTDQINKTIKFYNNQHNQNPISRLVLSGGSARLPGLIEHLSSVTGLEVLLAAPFAPAGGNVPDVNHQAYIVCTGLLMRKGD